MNINKKRLAVFDWNGTILVDTIPAWRASNICLEFYDAPAISLKTFRETFHFPILHFYKLNGCSVDDILARKEEGNTVYQTAYERLAAHVRTRTGARKALEWLKNNEVHAIILSNYLTAKIEPQLDRLNLRPFFRHISAHNCDGTTILHSTTKAERLESFMTEYGYKPQDTVIIGDSAEEPDIGRRLGLASIGITDGYISRARLREAKPDRIIDSLAELPSLLPDLLDLPYKEGRKGKGRQ